MNLAPLIVACLAGIGALGAALSAILKTRPERQNLAVDASQKAVSLLRETLDELGDELERALTKVEGLQARLDTAIERTHELEQQLERERGKVSELEQLRVRLEGRLAELEQQHGG